MVKPTKTWKHDERKIASMFGTKRTPLSGGNSGHTRSDTLHPDLFIEVKRRQKHALVELYRDTAKLAKLENKIPMVCPVMPQGRERLVLLDIRDLEEVARIYRQANCRKLKFKQNE